MTITSYSEGDFTFFLNVSCGLLIQRSREMSEEPKPIGLYTVNIFSIDGPVAKVCGVESEDLRKDLIRYSEKLDAKKDLDWYRLNKKFKIEDVVRFAKQLDEAPLIFNVAG